MPLKTTHPMIVPEPDAALSDKAILSQFAGMRGRAERIDADRRNAAAAMEQAKAERVTDLVAGQTGGHAIAAHVASVEGEYRLRLDIIEYAKALAEAHRPLLSAAIDAEKSKRHEVGERLRAIGYSPNAGAPGHLPNFEFIVGRSADVLAATGRVQELRAKTDLSGIVQQHAKAAREIEERLADARRRLLASPV